MRSGLGNGDGFGDGEIVDAFISRLIFGEGSTSPAAYAASVPLVAPIGTHWAYSTGSSVLVASICGRIVGGGAEGTRDFLREQLFLPIGMRSAQPEFAASGEFVGGAFMHANARDWARFGYLYLRDGVWDGRRILPEGWVDYSRTPNAANNNATYGAHFWLNRELTEGQWPVLPGAPVSTFVAEGAYFQMVAIVPSLDLVAVRLGETQNSSFAEMKQAFGALVSTFEGLDVGSTPIGASP
jgi:CubicO group peptidase (beta-lactamase class C family)